LLFCLDPDAQLCCFVDILPAKGLFCLSYPQAALRIQCLRLQACYFDFDTERYDMGLGGCFADHPCGAV